MDTHLEERFAEAFVDVLRTELATNREVVVPGLGRFGIEHRPSTFAERPDGTTVLAPPEEAIVFEEEG